MTGKGSNLNEAGQDAQELVQFTTEGELIRPEGYREWVYIGTPLTPNDMNNGHAPFPEFHNVYIDPGSWDHYERTGDFREGTLLVKELVSVGSKQAVSGSGYFMGEFIGLEVAIKSQQRYPDEPGYWAYFSFGHEYPLADSAKVFPSQACNACHERAAADDFVFTQYYPVLRAGKASAKGEPIDAGLKSHDGATCQQCQESLSGFAETEGKARESSSETPSGSPGGIPIDKKALFSFLTDGEYKSFPAKESAMHPSAGPHSITGSFGLPVRTYLNPRMHESLEAGNQTHPEGAGIVKEMFSQQGELQGWAVSVKTQSESEGGRGWFWYEVTSTTDSNALVANGNGVAMCFSCHSIGKDFVLSAYPLK